MKLYANKIESVFNEVAEGKKTARLERRTFFVWRCSDFSLCKIAQGSRELAERGMNLDRNKTTESVPKELPLMIFLQPNRESLQCMKPTP